MSPVKFSPGALSDLARLQAFLKEKNPIASRKAAATIIQAIRILEHHPQIGRPVYDLDPVFRELVIGFGHYGYVALYHPLQSDWPTCEIVRHARFRF